MKISNFRNPQGNFTIIDNRIINDNRLTPIAFKLYCYIKSKPETWNFSCARIAKCLEISESSVQTHLKVLQKYGYFDRHFESLIVGRGKEAIYTIYDYEKAKHRFENGLIGKSQKEVENDDIQDEQEQNENKETQKSVKYSHIQEEKDEHSQARLITKNLFKWRGDEAQFTHDEFSEWLEYLKGIGFKINEISAKRHFEELLRLGENAKKAIDNSIFKGLKYPTLPYENTQAQGQSQGTTQGTNNQKPRYYTAKEIADGVAPDIINAGITLRYNPKLLNSKIGNNDYDSEFWGIVRAYDLTSYELRTNYKDFSIDREQREYINEAILQRIDFLKKKHPI